MDATKIRLSTEEAALVMRSDWILTKNRILQKVKQLLEMIQDEEQEYLATYSFLPEEVSIIGPKISKGENYKGLPYLVLDLPRYFNKDHIFAIRTLFWWGHFFSTTLQLSGNYKTLLENKIIAAFKQLSKDDYFICINEDPWEHHFEAGNFVPLNALSLKQFEKIIRTHPFLKLSKKIPLTQWNNVRENVTQVFRQFLTIAGD
ncbi:MAG: hypothetical protein ABIR18_14105 [Chitinophagaceae bacterium]